MMPDSILFLCLAAFGAGFIDAIVGGGGLVQTPATLIALPQYPVATLLGTTKIPSFLGTSMAAVQYARIVKLRWRLLALMCLLAMVAAYAGSKTVSMVSNQFMKPVIFIILILVLIYTYRKKDFGSAGLRKPGGRIALFQAAAFALLIGFYDGFIGPGAGSFLVVFFISVLGFDFLKASAHAKFVNLATNTGSILFFGPGGHILFQYAFPMAACNFLGSMLGARLAILKGNAFIRVFFLAIITATLIRFGYDLFFRS
jgi:uncharacterized membrane protein YfcA